MPDPVRYATVVVLLAALAACGGDEDREVMKPEETVFRDLVTGVVRAKLIVFFLINIFGLIQPPGDLPIDPAGVVGFGI